MFALPEDVLLVRVTCYKCDVSNVLVLILIKYHTLLVCTSMYDRLTNIVKVAPETLVLGIYHHCGTLTPVYLHKIEIILSSKNKSITKQVWTLALSSANFVAS